MFPAASRWVTFSPHYLKRITTNWANDKGDFKTTSNLIYNCLINMSKIRIPIVTWRQVLVEQQVLMAVNKDILGNTIFSFFERRV